MNTNLKKKNNDYTIRRKESRNAMEWGIIGIMQQAANPVPFPDLHDEVEVMMKTRYKYAGANDNLRLRAYDILQNLCDKGFLSREPGTRHYVAEKKLAELQVPEEHVALADTPTETKNANT